MRFEYHKNESIPPLSWLAEISKWGGGNKYYPWYYGRVLWKFLCLWCMGWRVWKGRIRYSTFFSRNRGDCSWRFRFCNFCYTKSFARIFIFFSSKWWIPHFKFASFSIGLFWTSIGHELLWLWIWFKLYIFW